MFNDHTDYWIMKSNNCNAFWIVKYLPNHKGDEVAYGFWLGSKYIFDLDDVQKRVFNELMIPIHLKMCSEKELENLILKLLRIMQRHEETYANVIKSTIKLFCLDDIPASEDYPFFKRDFLNLKKSMKDVLMQIQILKIFIKCIKDVAYIEHSSKVSQFVDDLYEHDFD